MRGRLPSPPIPGQTVGGGVPDAPRRLALPPFPGLLPAETRAAANTPRRGQDPSLRTEPLTPAYVNPRAGHARPLPCGGPGTAAREQLPVSTLQCFHIPIRRAGCPTPPRPSVTARSRANRRGRRPRRPAKACAAALPRVATRGDLRCRQHPAEGSRPLPTDRTIDACLRKPPGRACPAPTVRRPGNGGPGTAARVNPTVFPYPHP